MGWKHARDNNALDKQWQRRADKPLPFILQEVTARMLDRFEVLKPAEGDAIYQGWLHSALLEQMLPVFNGRILYCYRTMNSQSNLKSSQKKTKLSNLIDRFKNTLNINRTSSSEIVYIDKVLNNSLSHKTPMANESVAVVWSPLWLHCLESPTDMLKEWHRILKPEGCVFFSCFGPDTAGLLRRMAAAHEINFPDYMDMHDLGDMLVGAGFANPVMEMEKVTLTYRNQEKLIQEWREVVGNNLKGRAQGLKGRAFYQSIHDWLGGQVDQGSGVVALELELVYGHAWKVKSFGNAKEYSIPVSSIGKNNLV